MREIYFSLIYIYFVIFILRSKVTGETGFRNSIRNNYFIGPNLFYTKLENFQTATIISADKNYDWRKYEL